MTKVFYKIIAVAATLLLAACGTTSNPQQVSWQYEPPSDFTLVHAVGYAQISNQRGADHTARQLRAMKASKLDAYRELSEQVYGQRIEGSATVSDMVLANEHLAASVAGVIRGARVIRAYALEDTYVTELELDFREVYRVTMSMNPNRSVTTGSTKKDSSASSASF
ncbi:LPP20 family lipoprotein [Aliagarivorans marinus]|uniref:LPP20 family lipoprotein n=1 Tax=Aliagarivorans marinus TaxID=561965 RepID=UPI00040185E6|nr:LPP20 family lipoprotein [Aliagarivorans marinus]